MYIRQPQRLLKLAIGWLPSPIDMRVLESLRWLGRGETRRKQRRVARILAKLGRGTKVQGGPFRGMQYLGHRSASQGEFLPKFLGTYEMELSPVLDETFALRPDIVVNIGAAEGYYAVGFALRSPSSRVLAFEMETPYHTAIRELATRNGVARRVEVRGECRPHELEAVLARSESPVVLCDCEGAEDDLLRPNLVPGLHKATILVEIHELLCPGVGERIRGRFADTHRIQILSTRPRTMSDLPDGIDLAVDDVSFALGEGRHGQMEWYFMVPNSSGAAAHNRPSGRSARG